MRGLANDEGLKTDRLPTAQLTVAQFDDAPFCDKHIVRGQAPNGTIVAVEKSKALEDLPAVRLYYWRLECAKLSDNAQE